MTDESQPDHVEDPKPDQDEQALAGTGNEEQDDLDTAREMETIVPSSADELDSATIPGAGPSPEKIVLEGDAVPGYDLLGELGRGGMGVVYKARDQKLKRIVALKMILSGTHASEEDMQRFQTEAEAVARLQHPNIVQIFEVAEHEGRPYIALEFADGGSLDQKIAGTPQNAAESAQLVETLARAMQQAHDNEIIHRDLKPANILLTADGEPRITDFGLAKRLDEDSSQTKSGAVMGTPSYMAPEQAASNSTTLGPAADTYALGAILYHMLTGRPPFQAETQLDTIMQVIAEEPVAPRKLNSSLPVDLETICLKCLEKDVHRRYESAEALAEDLRRFGAGEPIHARPVSVITRGLKWAKRRPAVAGMIGISAAALVALVAGGLWYNAQLVRERDVAQQQSHRAFYSEQQAKLAEVMEYRQRKRAEEQKEAADRNFELARNAVDELTTVSEDELFNLPRMEPVREALLEKAKEFYETFVAQAAGDPELAAELANAHWRLGKIQTDLGNLSGAKPELEKTIEVYSQLVKDHPDLPNYAANLGGAYSDLGRAMWILGQSDDAIDQYNKSIVIKQQLVKDHPKIPEYASGLVASYINLGITLNHRGKTEEAIQLYNKAILIYVQLAKDDRNMIQHAPGFAHCYQNLGDAFVELGKQEDAIKFYNKAIAIREQLVKAQPEVLEHGLRLALSYNNLALILRDAGKTDEAIKFYNKATRITEQLVMAHPDVPRYASNLAQTYNNLALNLRSLQRFDEAITTFNKTIVIQEQLVKDHPEVPDYVANLTSTYTNLANTLFRLQNFDKAMQFFNKATVLEERLVKGHPDVPKYANSLLKTKFSSATLEEYRSQYSEAIRHYESSLPILKSLKSKGQLQRQLAGTEQRIEQGLTRCRTATRAVEDLAFLLAQPPAQAARFLVIRGKSQLDRSNHAGTAESGEKLAELKVPDDQPDARQLNLYNAACLLSLASGAAAKDEDLAEADRAALVDKYASRAVALLKEDHSLGYFKDPANVAHMKQDTDFAPLRQRGDFKQLVKELEENLQK